MHDCVVQEPEYVAEEEIEESDLSDMEVGVLFSQSVYICVASVMCRRLGVWRRREVRVRKRKRQ